MGVIGLALVVLGISFGQSAPAEKKAFLIRIQPVRPTFTSDITPAEQKIMGSHFAYLKKLAAEGKVVLAGPSDNGVKTFGIIVVEVASEEEAQAILEGDPSQQAGVMKGEVLPFHIAIMRGR
jgi:uncharacterized protein YciI